MLLPLLFLFNAHAAGARASSTLTDEDKKRHPADMAVDGLLRTSWAEGESGYGENSWLEIDLGSRTDLRSLSIWPGDLSDGARSHRESSRLRLVKISLDGQPYKDPIRLQDALGRVDIPLEGSAKVIRIEAAEVYEGFVYSDLHIAEVAVNFPDVPSRVTAWLQGSEAARLLEKHHAQVAADYEAHKAAQFGDEAAFGRLCLAAADGDPAYADRIRGQAPVGYRIQSIPSSDKAREALRKLGDANAIPCLEMAAQRVAGAEQRARLEEVEIFYAYQELIGGPDLNIPNWGTEGWERGALQSFGEPLALEMDRFYNLLVADTGNNRIQRFTDAGSVDRQWGGGEPDITNAWFTRGRKWYVTGAAAGDKIGQFLNPIDVEILPGKEADGFAVLDAKGRVQIFDEEGRPTISWVAETTSPPEPKLGGQGYLVWLPGRDNLVVIQQDEAIVYTLQAEEVARWSIKDGTPAAVEAAKGGSGILMAFNGSIILYNHDGFRHGSVIEASTFREGFESLDLTWDEEGKLWILTDDGWIYRFKKPGKVEFSLQIIDRPIKAPRIAVREGTLYLTSDDRIERIDVLQAKLDQDEARAKEEGEGGGKKKGKKKKGEEG